MDDSGLSQVIVNAWLPKDPLPEPEEDAPARKPLETLLIKVPERLKASAPYAKIKALEATIAENKAKLEAGEVTEEEYDAQPEVRRSPLVFIDITPPPVMTCDACILKRL